MGLSQTFLQLCALRPKLAPLAGIWGLHPTVLGSPFVKSGITKAAAAAQLFVRLASRAE